MLKRIIPVTAWRLLGYWSFNNTANPWMGNLGEEPLNASDRKNPASPWGGALQVDTNSAANLSYNYGEASTGAENVRCLNGAVSFSVFSRIRERRHRFPRPGAIY